VAVLAAVLADLQAESADLDTLVAALDAAQWQRDTPAPGWTIAHQIGHLAWTDDLATLAATDHEGFDVALRSVVTEFEGYIDRAAAEWAAAPELLTGWRDGRAMLASALQAVPAGAKLPWFGPPLSATSMATARLMETWAHGQDIADALGFARPPTHRLRHVAHLGIRTRDFAYRVRDLTPPATPFRVELQAPDGSVWTWGDPGAVDRVTGPALDFCLLVTQRRNRSDLDLVATGAADAWLDIAQAFAGPPGAGRAAQPAG
jgi:uncharacterized protein (TIGR03084 family)